MSAISQINNTKSLNALLKDVLINNEMTYAVPELTNELSILLKLVKVSPVEELIPQNIIGLLDEAFRNYYTQNINSWSFDKVYTKTERYSEDRVFAGYWKERQRDRIEFSKLIPTNELSNYLKQFKQLGFTIVPPERFDQAPTRKLKNDNVCGLEIEYASSTDITLLRISTLLKTNYKKGFQRYLI